MTHYELVAWRQAYAASEQRWACRFERDEDGTVRIYPLYVDDLPAWVAARWDYPEYDAGMSLEPL